MPNKCKTCQSERCGNHAACARKAQQRREEGNWHSKSAMNIARNHIDWNMFMAAMYVDMRGKQRLSESAELAEFLYFQQHEPTLYVCLEQIAIQRQVELANLKAIGRALFMGLLAP